MTTLERRWSGPAAAALVFCLTLILVAPPTSPSVSAPTPAAFLADAAAASAGHVILGVVATAGLVLAARQMLQRRPLKAQQVATPSAHINAA